MKKKLRVIFIPDKLQYKANKMNGTRLFYYFDKISKNNPLLYALFNATFKVINKIDYEIIENGNIKEVVFQDEISFSYDGKVYVSMFELIKKLNEEIYEIRLDNRFMKTEGEVPNVHIRFLLL